MQIIKNINKYYRTDKINDITQVGQQHKESNKMLNYNYEDQRYYPLKEIQDNLTGLRKEYDNLKTSSNIVEKDIVTLRNEVEQMKQLEEVNKNITSDKNELLKQLKEQKEGARTRETDALMNQQTYQQMIQYYKHDIQVYKRKIKETEQSVKVAQQVNEKADTKMQKFKQKHQKTKVAVDQVYKNYESLSQKRMQKIVDYQDNMIQVRQQDKAREDRIKKQQEIAEQAANESKDSNYKKWRKLLHVHNFLSFFLKKKMEREMHRYQQIEEAFQKIKASTGISDANEIVQKFLNREQTYSYLLYSIANYEKKIDQLKKVNEDLRNKIQKLDSDIMPLEQFESKADEREIQEEQAKSLEISNRAEFCKLQEEKFHNWLNKNIKKIKKARGEEINPENDAFTENAENIPDLYQQIIQILRDDFVEQKIEIEDVDKDINVQYKQNSIYNNDISKKNIRVELEHKRENSDKVSSVNEEEEMEPIEEQKEKEFLYQQRQQFKSHQKK